MQKQQQQQQQQPYQDYASLPLTIIQQRILIPRGKRKGPRGGVVTPFPVRLQQMLADTDPSIVSWLPHGRAFCVHQRQAFCAQVLPRYVHVTAVVGFVVVLTDSSSSSLQILWY